MSQIRDDYKYSYINGTITNQVDSGQGRLIRIIVTKAAAGAVDIIDGTSGSTGNIGVLKASIAEGVYEFGVGYTTGLRIVLAGSVDLTVVYRPLE